MIKTKTKTKKEKPPILVLWKGEGRKMKERLTKAEENIKKLTVVMDEFIKQRMEKSENRINKKIKKIENNNKRIKKIIRKIESSKQKCDKNIETIDNMLLERESKKWFFNFD